MIWMIAYTSDNRTVSIKIDNTMSDACTNRCSTVCMRSKERRRCSNSSNNMSRDDDGNRATTRNRPGWDGLDRTLSSTTIICTEVTVLSIVTGVNVV